MIKMPFIVRADKSEEFMKIVNEPQEKNLRNAIKKGETKLEYYKNLKNKAK